MEFDCKTQHHKCKAKCCATIDFENDFWEKHQDKVVTKPVALQPFSDGQRIWPVTESGYCPFLREDYLCNIYEDRPDICREYGSESTPYM